MENSKKTIIKKLHEAGNDKAAMQASFNDRLKDAEDVVKTSLGSDTPPDEVKDIAARLATESVETTGFNPVVQYHSDRANEEPFMINGIKWQYVNAIYPDGKRDIAVYRYGHDLAYDYKWFMDNVVGRLKNSNGVSEVNQEVLDKFTDQYGKENGKQVYYATANKQDRNPETFKNESDDEIASRGIEHGMNPEVGGDKYDEYRQLMQQLAADDQASAAPSADNPYHKDNRGKSRFSHKGLEEEGGMAPEPTNDPVKLKADVEKLMAKLDMTSIAPYLQRIDNPVEQAEVIAQFAEKIGVPKAKLSSVVAQLKMVAETKMTKDKLIETVAGISGAVVDVNGVSDAIVNKIKMEGEDYAAIKNLIVKTARGDKSVIKAIYTTVGNKLKASGDAKLYAIGQGYTSPMLGENKADTTRKVIKTIKVKDINNGL